MSFIRATCKAAKDWALRHKFQTGMVTIGVGAVISQIPKPPSHGTTLHIDMENLKLTNRKLTQSDHDELGTIETADFINTLLAARDDKSIERVVATYGNGSIVERCGLADLEEIKKAFKVIHDSGKQVFFLHDNILDTRMQYLRQSSTYSLVKSTGVVKSSRPPETHFYFRRLLDLLGIRATVFQQGKYKSGVAMFNQSGSTRAKRENTKSVQDSIEEILRRDNPNANNHPVEVPTEIMNFDTPSMALIDYVEHLKFTEAKSRFLGELKTAIQHYNAKFAFDFRDVVSDNLDMSVDIRFGLNGAGASVKRKSILPIIHVSDTIDLGNTRKVVASIELIHSAIDNGEDIKHVILRVDSPGGDSGYSQVISNALAKLPVPYTASFGNYATSGGYWVSASADRIFSNEMSYTGSIGAYAVRWDVSQFLVKYGINVEYSDHSPDLHTNNVLHPTTRAISSIYSSDVKATYENFISHVAKRRNMPHELVRELAEGRLYTGRQAKENGLVDEIGSLVDVVQYVREKYQIDDAIVKSFPEPEPLTRREIDLQKLVTDQNASAVEMIFAVVSAMYCLFNCHHVLSPTVLLVVDEETAIQMALRQLGEVTE